MEYDHINIYVYTHVYKGLVLQVKYGVRLMQLHTKIHV